MIKLENYEVVGWEHAIRGMRNPKNSWGRMDSAYCHDSDCKTCPYRDDLDGCFKVTGDDDGFIVGPNDQGLMEKLAKGGPVHAKYRRMIAVYVDITAPLYWWKEFKTYRAGRKFGDEEPDVIPDDYLEQDIEMNSCSTMHKIHSKEFEMDDFSCDMLSIPAREQLRETIKFLEMRRVEYVRTKDKRSWYDIIQLLPSSYNQKRTVMLNYEVLANMYKWRRAHKLDEWVRFCEWIELLPYSWIITGEKNEY
jgi:hypothetical protein